MTKDERLELLKTQEAVIDEVVIGGETFERSSSMFAGRMYSHFRGQYGDRYYKATVREGLAPHISVIVR